ncbi:V8-like Glu-specific endopeptidase [Elusimicrobium posterum]|uniref:hypothetical protein n=1 Tax=Elusimicrobium posterum TaxID=3116653 RepID=UPI003C78AFC9
MKNIFILIFTFFYFSPGFAVAQGDFSGYAKKIDTASNSILKQLGVEAANSLQKGVSPVLQNVYASSNCHYLRVHRNWFFTASHCVGMYSEFDGEIDFSVKKIVNDKNNFKNSNGFTDYEITLSKVNYNVPKEQRAKVYYFKGKAIDTKFSLLGQNFLADDYALIYVPRSSYKIAMERLGMENPVAMTDYASFLFEEIAPFRMLSRETVGGTYDEIKDFSVSIYPLPDKFKKKQVKFTGKISMGNWLPWKNTMKLSGQAVGGMSGSPVIYSDTVVGVLVATSIPNEKSALSYNVEVIALHEEFKKFMKKTMGRDADRISFVSVM